MTTLSQPKLALDTLARTLSVLASEDITDVGVYRIASKITLVNYPTTFGGPEGYSPPFTLTVIDPCAIPTVEPLAIEMQEYTIFDALAVLSLPKFTIEPTFCNCTYTFESELITFEPIMELEQGTHDLALAFFSDELGMTSEDSPDYFVDYPVLITMISGSVVSETTFDLRILNPCINPTKVLI